MRKNSEKLWTLVLACLLLGAPAGCVDDDDDTSGDDDTSSGDDDDDDSADDDDDSAGDDDDSAGDDDDSQAFAPTPVAAHLGGVAYYDDMFFANGLAIENRNWHTAAAVWGDQVRIPYMLDETTWNPQLDDRGNPQYLDPGQVLIARIWNNDGTWHRPGSWPNNMLYQGHSILEGRTTLSWQGTADIRITNASSLIEGTDTGIETAGTRVYLTPADTTLTVEIHEIDPKDPPREIRVWLPDPSDWDGASLVGQTFHPVLLDRLSDRDWAYIRFMDWNPTNNSPQRDWSDRRRPDDTFQTGAINLRSPLGAHADDPEINDVWGGGQATGVAYEHMVALCNEVGKSIYITVPHLAADDYITSLARLIAYGSDGELPYEAAQADPVHRPLDSDLKVYVEFSNEIWNWSFAQRVWADAEAAAAGITVEQLNATQFSRTWEIFESILGEGRVVRSAAVWTSNSFYTDPFISAFYDDPGLLEPEVMAVTTYMGNGIQNWVNEQGFVPTDASPWDDPYWESAQLQDDMDAAFDQWLQMYFDGASWVGDTGPDGVGDKGIPSASTDTAAARGLPIICYEGGPSIYTNLLDEGAPEDDGVTLFMSAMNRQPRFAEIYDLHLNMARAQGLWTHMPFVLSGNWGKFGQWGHLEWLLQDPEDSVKYTLMLDQFDEFSAIRHPSDPLGAVPSFVTDAELPPAMEDQPYSATLAIADGDGATTVDLVGALLPDGLAFDADTRTLSGTPTEDMSSRLYVRLTDQDGDPAWREFTLEVVDEAVGWSLVEWAFETCTKADWHDVDFPQSPDSTDHHGSMLPSSIGVGPGLNMTTNPWYNEDAYAATGADSVSLDEDDYLSWTIEPAAGETIDLLQLRMGLFAASGTYDAELRVSQDGFVSYEVASLTPSPPLTGVGIAGQDGTEVIADLSGISLLSSLTGAVEFRLYLWSAGFYTAVGVGKLGSGEVDLVLSGLVD